MSELLPCPFCGGTDLKIKTGMIDGEHAVSAVYCMTCAGSGAFAEIQDHAVETWNRRAPPPGDGALREAEEQLKRGVLLVALLRDAMKLLDVAGLWKAPVDEQWRESYADLRKLYGAALARPAQTQGDTDGPTLCTCLPTFDGKYADSPTCRFHHPPPPAPQRWVCTNCGLEVEGSDAIAHAGLPTTIRVWHRNADGEWCGPVKPRKEGEG
jgi:Lar family restriction alleviation protein